MLSRSFSGSSIHLWHLTGIVIVSIIFSLPVFAGTSDHIGPDPIQSEKCVMITPERSITCVGRQLTPNSNLKPMVTINCKPGIFILLTHRPMATQSSTREVRLISEEGQFTSEWLALSETQSGFLVVYRGLGSDDYAWMLRLLGQLNSLDSSLFGYSFDSQQIEGIFEFNYSDRKMIEQLIPNCG
ncbi:MAG: hypothetical protein F4082_06355 [Gammaproteobacteria bacterium]|nr:hypothetical protein [Gammaproteobacteria bacterium]